MKKFKFKDGLVITASCAEEAKAKHKVMASEQNEYTKEELKILNKYNFNKTPETGELNKKERYINGTQYVFVSIIKDGINKYHYEVDYMWPRKGTSDKYMREIYNQLHFPSKKYNNIEEVAFKASTVVKILEKSCSDLKSYVSSFIRSVKSSIK